MPRQEAHFALRGGLDLVSSPLTVDSGRIITGLNYVVSDAGYRRIAGYERFDGRPSPSDAIYWLLGYTGGPASVGDTITGGTSGATAVVLAVTDDEYVLGTLDGSFENGETLDSGAGAAEGTPRRLGAATINLDLDYRDLAAANLRSPIQAVPGSGPVRGVWFYKNELYAFRDNAAGDAGGMHKATPTGWSTIDITRPATLDFDAGLNTINDGATINGQTSGATARVTRVEIDSGSFRNGDAVGTLTLTNIMGTFQDDERIRINTTPSATVRGALSPAVSLPAGGSYRFLNHNFLGQADTVQMFGVNGVGQAFSFDGTTLTNIATGHADDRPTHIAVQNNHLLLGYRGGSLIVSATGSPASYDASAGAAEIACGQDILGLAEGVGLGNTLIMGADRIQVLYGQDVEDFRLSDVSDAQTGGVEGTLQNVGGPIYMDNRGVRSITTTEAYGNFVIGTMTANIQPWIDSQRQERNVAVGSLRVRSNDQYLLWFASGIGVCIYLGRGRPEISFVDYGLDSDDNKIFPRCSVSAEDSDRIERVFFGADNGFVYEAERGRSFDGREITAYARLPLNHVGQPSRNKRFHSCDLHIDVASRVRLELSALYDDAANPEQLLTEESIHGGGGLWEEGFFEEFYYDSPLNGFATWDLFGFGRNVSILMRSVTAKEPPHTLNGLSLRYSDRRRER